MSCQDKLKSEINAMIEKSIKKIPQSYSFVVEILSDEQNLLNVSEMLWFFQDIPPSCTYRNNSRFTFIFPCNVSHPYGGVQHVIISKLSAFVEKKYGISVIVRIIEFEHIDNLSIYMLYVMNENFYDQIKANDVDIKLSLPEMKEKFREKNLKWIKKDDETRYGVYKKLKIEKSNYVIVSHTFKPDFKKKDSLIEYVSN